MGVRPQTGVLLCSRARFQTHSASPAWTTRAKGSSWRPTARTTSTCSTRLLARGLSAMFTANRLPSIVMRLHLCRLAIFSNPSLGGGWIWCLGHTCFCCDEYLCFPVRLWQVLFLFSFLQAPSLETSQKRVHHEGSLPAESSVQEPSSSSRSSEY